MTTLVLYKKELFAFWRSSKWLWLPIVFVLLGVMQPITIYYMPEILKATGGLPEGAVFELPTPSGAEVMAGVLSQYNTIGIVIIVAAVMGTIHTDRQRGTMSLIMSRPVSAWQYLISKWSAELTIMFVSLFVSYGLSVYYTQLLFSHIPIDLLVKSFFIYFIWVSFIITVTLLCSLLFKQIGAVMAVSIIVVALLSLLDDFLEKYMKWSPSLLSTQASSLLVEGGLFDYFWINIVSSLGIMIALLFIMTFIFNKQERY